MKKLIALAVLALPLVGCAAATGTSGTLYESPALGDRVGNIIWIEDPVHGTLIYKYVSGTGSGTLRVLTKKDGVWVAAEK